MKQTSIFELLLNVFKIPPLSLNFQGKQMLTKNM